MQPILSPERLSFLAELGSLLNSSLTPQLIVETALRYLRGQLDALSCCVHLGNKIGRELQIWLIHIDNAEIEQHKARVLEQSIPGKVIKSMQPIEASNVNGQSNFVRAIPIIARETRLIGVMEVNKDSAKGTFSREDCEFLQRVAHQLAIALDNAILFQELQRSNAKLNTLNKRKDDMISVISHEIRTPLTVLESSLDLLLSDRLSSTQRQTMRETLSKGLERLNRVTRRLKEVTVTRLDHLKLTVSSVKLAEIFTLLEQELCEPCKRRNIQFTVSLPDQSLIAQADQVYLLVALKNLLENAIRFTPDGGMITLSATAIDSRILLEVQDNGIGMDKDQLPLIFETFYGALDPLYHSSGKYEFQSGGLGLGLSTVKSIIDAHKTDIEVYSEKGKGSRFCFQLERIH